MKILQEIEAFLGEGQVKTQESLAKHTTLGIGGPADFFYQAKTEKGLIQAIKVAKRLNLPYFILGGGSNILISDKGIRGLVIKNLIQGFSFKAFSEKFTPPLIKSRLVQLEPEKYLEAKKQPQSSCKKNPYFLVTVGSGWRLNSLINHCLDKGLVGLEWFGGIPGTIGGAIYMNIHGGHYFFSDFVYGVRVWDFKTQKTKYLPAEKLTFAYDYSLLQKEPMVILTADLILGKGNVVKARRTYQDWLRKKSQVQPARSCGSVWQNLTDKIRKEQDLPTSSVGYLIDKKLQLKGKRLGRAQVSLKHAGFIENLGRARASDVLKLMCLVEEQAKEKLGIDLKREVILKGDFNNG